MYKNIYTYIYYFDFEVQPSNSFQTETKFLV